MTTKIEKIFTCSCGSENRIILDTNVDDTEIICHCKCGKRYKFVFRRFALEEEEVTKSKEESKEEIKEEIREEETGKEEEETEEDLLSKIKEKEEMSKLGEISSGEEDELAGLFGLR